MARDEAAIARRYDQDGTRDIFKPPQAPEWNACDQLFVSSRRCVKIVPNKTCFSASRTRRRSRGCRVLSGQDGISSAALPEIE